MNVIVRAVSFEVAVKYELQTAREKHANINNAHEASAVIREEFEEFWDEVKKREHDLGAMLNELIQIAAMCQRTAEDIGLVPHYTEAAK